MFLAFQIYSATTWTYTMLDVFTGFLLFFLLNRISSMLETTPPSLGQLPLVQQRILYIEILNWL